MRFLDRNTLPRFQERLDLSASELNDAEDILTEAINELAGRVFILANMVEESEREQYAEETNCKLLSTLDAMQNFMVTLESRVDAIESRDEERFEELENRLTSYERRLNALDDAAARKQDLAVVLWRTAVALNKGDMNNDGRITLQDVILLLKEYQGGGGEDLGPEQVVYTPSICNFGNHPPVVGQINTLYINNSESIAELRHVANTRIMGSNIDPNHTGDINIAKGIDHSNIDLRYSGYEQYANQPNALWIELYTYKDNGDGTWEYIGKTTNKFTLLS